MKRGKEGKKKWGKEGRKEGGEVWEERRKKGSKEGRNSTVTHTTTYVRVQSKTEFDQSTRFFSNIINIINLNISSMKNDNQFGFRLFLH